MSSGMASHSSNTTPNNMTNFSITPEEQEAISNATPKQWAAAIVDVATDLSFWKELTVTMLTAFIGGFDRGLNKSREN
jgi:hypothetical protein